MNHFPAFKPHITSQAISNINKELEKLSISGNCGESIKKVEAIYSELNSCCPRDNEYGYFLCPNLLWS